MPRGGHAVIIKLVLAFIVGRALMRLFIRVFIDGDVYAPKPLTHEEMWEQERARHERWNA